MHPLNVPGTCLADRERSGYPHSLESGVGAVTKGKIAAIQGPPWSRYKPFALTPHLPSPREPREAHGGPRVHGGGARSWWHGGRFHVLIGPQPSLADPSPNLGDPLGRNFTPPLFERSVGPPGPNRPGPAITSDNAPLSKAGINNNNNNL